MISNKTLIYDDPDDNCIHKLVYCEGDADVVICYYYEEQFRLACIYFNGYLAKRNHKKANHYFHICIFIYILIDTNKFITQYMEAAADKNYPFSQFIHEKFHYVKRDMNKAFLLLLLLLQIGC